MRNKCFKRICSVFMAVLMMVCGALSYIGGTAKNVYAEKENLQSSAEVSDSQLKSELSELYQKCLQNSGKSNFHGWCGSFVGHQLKALGISTKTSSGFTGNGNTWYPCLLNNVETDSGHTQVKYPGRDCLKNIVADSGDEPAYNIVVSFPNSTGSNTSYGHVIFIYAIVGNTAYYIESYGTKFGAEGTPIARNIDELMNEYCGLYGNAQGAVWFSGGGGLYYVNDNEMYSTYPWYLKDSTYDQIFSNSRAEINNALHEADKSSAIIAITTAMKEGKDLLIKELLSLVSDEIDSTSEEALDAATVDFIQTMLGNETFLTSSIKSIEKNVKQIKLVCDFTTEVGKTEFAESAGKLLGQSSSAIKTKLDKLLGDNSKMLKIAKYGLKVSEVVAASVELEYINIEIVERIGELLETYGYDDTELYEGISRLITKLHTGMLDRIFDKIADDAVLEILSKVADTALELLVSEDMGFVIAIIDLAAQISVVLIYEKLFDGIKLDDTLEAYAKNQFMDVLFSLKADMQIDMLYGQADSDTIAEDYELIWNAYRACIVSGLDSAKSITRSKSQQSICQQWMNTLTTTCSYDSFFERCRASAMEAVSNGTAITVGSSAGADAVTKSEAIVVKKLNSLLDMYPSGESTFEIMYNNKMGSFAFTEFVFNMLFNNILNGTISTSAQYRYSKYNSVKNVGTLSGSEISEDAIGMLMENAKIGDVILAYGEKYGVHSMIFKEASENGITVYDCGWDSENNGEYGVLLHEIPYSELASWTGTGTTESEGGLSLYHYYDYDHLYTNSGSIMADDKENFIIDENGVLTGYKGYKTFIKIPDTVTSIADEAFYNNDMIRNVYIPSSVTSIGARAFYDCDQLTSVFIPDSVITVGSSCFYSCGSLVYAKLSQNMGTISSSMFYDCKNLETVVMGMNVTEIGSSAFYNCVKLADVELPGGLTSLGRSAFRYCTSLVKMTIPKSLTSCGGDIFSGCSNLKTINFEEGITVIPASLFNGNDNIWFDGLEEIYIPDTVTTIGSSAFVSCKNLVSVTGMKNVTWIGDYVFSGCVKMADVELPAGLTSLGWSVFRNCTSLVKMTIPKSLTSCGWDIFSGCSNLKTINFEEGITLIPNKLFYGRYGWFDGLEEINIPDTVTTIGNCAFYNCINLSSVTGMENVTKIGDNAFNNCGKLADIELPLSLINIGDGAFCNCVNLSDVELPVGLTSIGDYAFQNCTSLVRMTIPKSLTSCGWDIFSDCSNLKTINFEEGITTIPDDLFWGFSGWFDGLEEIYIPDTVTTIGDESFYNCKNLASVTGMKNVTKIGYNAFRNCEKLKDIELPAGLTSCGANAFQNCKSLVEITIPDTLNSWGGWTFADCSSLVHIDIANSITSIPSNTFNGCTSLSNIKLPEELKIIRNEAFQGSGLTEITIPDKVTSIESYAFKNCTSLIEANVPDSVTSMGSYVFDGCSSLTDVSLGSGITSIPDYAFSNCESLEAIKIPYNVTTIGQYVFLNDTAFKEITIPRKTESINSNSFSYPWDLTIYGISGTYAETFASDNSINFVNREVNAEKVELDVTEVTLLKGESKNLIMTVTPSDFTDAVTWKSTDTNVVTVTDAGVINAVGAGTATVKLTVGNVSTQCKVTVLQPVTSISLNRTSLSLDALGTYQLVASVYPSTANNQNVVWESSDTSVATVDENGLVTALKKGTTTITVKSTDGSNISRSCTVTVNNTVFNCDTVEQLESPHNYTDGCSDSWMYTLEGAEKLNVTFDAATAVEDGFDYIYIYTADNILVGKYTGSELSGKTILVEGDTVRIKLVSDSSGNERGFKVTSVQSVVTHQMSFIPAVSATCTKDGNNAYYYCSDCGKYFNDEAGTIETTVEAEKIAATGHSEVTDEAVEATCETEGKTEGSHCSVCGKVIRAQETVDKKDHEYENGHCIYCGRSQYTASWIKDDNGWKYRNEDGTYVNNGWKAISSKWYYFNNSGYMVTGWLQDGNKWYYLESTGKMATGWKQISGSWYYFESSGLMAANKWVDGVYYMKANGTMAVNEWVDGGRYYVDSNGKWIPNKTKASWKKDSKGWWYDNGDGTYPKSTWKSIDGSWYYFNNSGYMVTGWLNDGGKWYYLESNGKMASSKWINGTYYVKANGVMATNEWVDGGRYYVDANGKWVA